MRHRTLKWKFTVTFISMMALAVTATWCINNWFLEGYYQNYKIGVLEKGYHAIDTIVLEEKKNGGSGIGLSIVKAIMDSHHKKYGVRNLENGVEFWFTLDCSRKA